MSTLGALRSLDPSGLNMSSPDLGAADIIQGTTDGPGKWPRAHDGFLYIHYCFMDVDTRNVLSDVMYRAFALWYTALGGAASKDSGHAIIFQECMLKNGQPAYCKVDNNAREHGWNPNIPYGTLLIHLGDQDSATFRLMREGRKEPWQTGMYINRYLNPYAIAHEVGHVLGELLVCKVFN